MIQLGIVGHPLHHTLSPVLHQQFLQACGLSGTYQVYDTELLANTIEQLKARGLRGFNVTIPYKVSILRYLDELTPRARLLQAVNTVKIEGERLVGDNTDMPGYLNALPPVVYQTLSQRRVVMLGAGGASRAVLAGLVDRQVECVTVVARRAEQAEDLAAMVPIFNQASGSNTRAAVMTFDDLVDLSRCDMLVNTTPVGMHPQVDASPLNLDLLHSLPVDAFVSDLIYRPMETSLVAEARAAGYPAENSLGMLVYQAVHAFEWWTGQRVPESVIEDVFTFLKTQLC